MTVESYGATDIGLVRLNNEDVFTILQKEGCYILADGMGGHKAGEIAAKETVTELSNIIKKGNQKFHSTEEWVYIIKTAIQKVNVRIFELAAQNISMEGMGTTLCLALITDDKIIYANVGDSRIYRLRKRRLEQLTQDHSLRGELIATGVLDEKTASSFPYKNVLTRAIGTQKEVKVDIATDTLQQGDLYLLCSDGLTDSLSDEQIQDILEKSQNLKTSCQNLIADAKRRGGSDNITIILIKNI